MIQVLFKDPTRHELVLKAMIRSLSEGQVTTINPSSEVWVTDELTPELLSSKSKRQKIIVFGRYPQGLSDSFTATTLASIFSPAEKKYEVQFHAHELTQNLFLQKRAFERFDFTTEWNNLGYGRIELDANSPFGIAEYIEPIAGSGIPYATVFDRKEYSILWVNRNVGPLDGFDWRMVEDFISDYRAKDLTCLPVLSEIPANFKGAVTMRIDCDEQIASGRPLFELYRKHNIPFSMAVKTQQEIGPAAITVMNEILAAGGSIVTHSHTHAPNWGGSVENAITEVETSRHLLKQALPEHEITYAVSPFHQNPPYAVKGIASAGIEAFVGGIIQNDPEYLIARSGIVPFAEGIISHSQQCMLHGDCYHDAGNSIEVYIAAFHSAFAGETFFGFLDHPFSNYQYGWHTEEERLGVHDEFLKILKKEPGLWFASLSESLDFLWDRAHTKIHVINGKIETQKPADHRSKKRLKARWRGQNIDL